MLKKVKRLGSECYAKSEKGLWIKSQLNDDGIELLWSVRTKRVGDDIHVFDSNGDVDSVVPISRFQYGSSMRSAGVVPLDDAFLEFCGADRFEDFANAAMRHVPYMLAVGYGETPEDIVKWWSDLNDEDRMYVGHGEYKIIEECEPFVDLVGRVGTVYMDDNQVLRVVMGVGEQEFDVPLETDNDIVSFIISTIPV